MTGLHKRHLVLISLALAIFWMIGCGGGSSTTVTTVLTDTTDPPGITNALEGENGSGGNGSVDGGSTESPVNPEFQPIQGQLGSAPLGTNPKYDVQEAESVIITRKVDNTTSSVGRSASQDGDNQVEWVSVVAHGDDPIPGGAGGPFDEGTKVDLYIRYNVYAGQLTLNRTWFIYACGLNYSNAYMHPSEGTYEAILPFIIPYGTAALDAVFKGIISLPRTVSVQIASDYVGVGEVPFEINYVPVFPPEYYPDEGTGDYGGVHPCMPDFGSISVYSDLHVESTDKGVGAVVYVFDDTPNELNGDEVAVKFSGLSGDTFDPTKESKGQGNPFPPINPKTGEPFLISQCTVVFVSSGCNASGWGPNYGWRFDAPFGVDGPDTNQVPTAQIVVEESLPEFASEAGVDYDYNDFVGTFRAVEMYLDPPGVSNNNGLLVQIELTVYAQACSVEEPNQWQLNVDCDMPLGTEVQALVQLFNNEKLPKPYSSDQVIYYSDSGFSVPVFEPLDQSMVYPETEDGTYASVNCDPWNCSQFVEGDYAEITITLSEPAGTGGYDPWPYVPVMWIGLPNEGAYSIKFWKEMGDELNADGMPQAMLLPDTYAWPLEHSELLAVTENGPQYKHTGVYIGELYPTFDTWVAYLNDPTKYPPLYNWYDADPYASEDSGTGGSQTSEVTPQSWWKVFSRDRFNPWPEQ
jgi:hypothetical protein